MGKADQNARLTDAPLLDTLRRAEVMIAIIDVLRRSWPEPVDLAPSLTGLDEIPSLHVAFVEAVHLLIDDGMVMADALLVGAGPEPIALAAVLTRRGAAVLYGVTRPL